MADPRVRLLGEVALRVRDLAAMAAFYRDVVGLEVWREYDDCVFFRVAEGAPGHPQALVLFDRGGEVAPGRSALDHLAFVIDLADHDEWRRRLENVGLHVRPKEFPLFRWRSLFVTDPDGNTVEFVCHDASLRAAPVPALVRSRAECEQLRFGAASEIALLADGAATGARFVLNEHVLQARASGPRPHRHADLIDSFYVVEGELTFQLDGEVVRASAGTYVLVPPGVLHTFANETDLPARFLGLSAPAGLDTYLRRTSDPYDEEEFAEAVADFDIEFAD